MARHLLGLVGWPATWIGLLYVLVVYLTPGFALLFAFPLCYAMYRTILQLRHLPTTIRTLRVLQHYPWQLLPNTPRGLDEHPHAEDGGIWIEFPDPSGRGRKGIPLTFVKHFRAYWWLRHIGGPRTKPDLKAALEPLWFAGDPRFLGVVAVTGRHGAAPRRLHFLYRPSAFEARATRPEWPDVTPADIERARRAGARYLPNVPAATPAGQES
ncbi:hypothetical protein GA0115233_103342 [Streptomyces sp. DI166]|nr:hypothetical protein GA0115233_103342 [Streptomyces sp. DI166]